MAATYADTEKMKDIATNIDNCAKEYDLLINKLFKRLIETPYISKEWIGDSANKYFKYVSLDKTDFIEYGTKIKEFSKRIRDDALAMENKITEVDKLEKGD